MNIITKIMSKEQIEQLKNQIDPYVLKVSQPAYTYYQAKLESCTITAYTSGKVVFQGKDLDWLSQESPSESNNKFPQAGSDEVGTGDYFGPVVVSAVIVSKENEDALRNLKIQDSKQINDEKIRVLAKEIKSICPHTVLIVSSSKYNSVHKQHNMVDIKCKLHNQAYLNLIKKGYTLPEQIIIDQFVQEKSYYRYLSNEKEVVRNIHFETKAENKYLAVACASVLARNAFLEYWDMLEEKFDFTFEKGAGKKVDQCGKEFVLKYGMDKLNEVAKIHFKNTEKILDLINK